MLKSGLLKASSAPLFPCSLLSSESCAFPFWPREGPGFSRLLSERCSCWENQGGVLSFACSCPSPISCYTPDSSLPVFLLLSYLTFHPICSFLSQPCDFATLAKFFSPILRGETEAQGMLDSLRVPLKAKRRTETLNTNPRVRVR